MATLFHISDIHFGSEDKAALNWFAEEVATHRPDAIICTGDLTMRGTPREFAEAARWLGSLAAPVSVEPGNHDMPYYWEMVTRLRHPFARYARLVEAVHRDLAVDGVALVSLPTVAPAQWRLAISPADHQRLLELRRPRRLYDVDVRKSGGIASPARVHPR